MSSSDEAELLAWCVTLPGNRLLTMRADETTKTHLLPTVPLPKAFQQWSLVPPPEFLENASCVFVRTATIPGSASGNVGVLALAFGLADNGDAATEVRVGSGYDTIPFDMSETKACPPCISDPIHRAVMAEFMPQVKSPRLPKGILAHGWSQKVVSDIMTVMKDSGTTKRQTLRIGTVSARTSGFVLALKNVHGRGEPRIVAFAKAASRRGGFAHEARVSQMAAFHDVAPKVIGLVDSTDGLMPRFAMAYGGGTLQALDPERMSRAPVQAFFRRYRKFQKAMSGLLTPLTEELDADDRLKQEAILKSVALCEDDLLDAVASGITKIKGVLGNGPHSEHAGAFDDAASALDLGHATKRQVEIMEGHHWSLLVRTVVHGDLTASNMTCKLPSKNILAIDWSDAFVGGWYMESVPFARYLDAGDTEGFLELCETDFFKSVVNTLVDSQNRKLVTVAAARKLFVLARPLRMLRRFLMTVRLYCGDSRGPFALFNVLDMIEYLIKARKSLKRPTSCRDEDSNLSDMDSEDKDSDAVVTSSDDEEDTLSDSSGRRDGGPSGSKGPSDEEILACVRTADAHDEEKEANEESKGGQDSEKNEEQEDGKGKMLAEGEGDCVEETKKDDVNEDGKVKMSAEGEEDGVEKTTKDDFKKHGVQNMSAEGEGDGLKTTTKDDVKELGEVKMSAEGEGDGVEKTKKDGVEEEGKKTRSDEEKGVGQKNDSAVNKGGGEKKNCDKKKDTEMEDGKDDQGGKQGKNVEKKKDAMETRSKKRKGDGGEKKDNEENEDVEVKEKSKLKASAGVVEALHVGGSVRKAATMATSSSASLIGEASDVADPAEYPKKRLKVDESDVHEPRPRTAFEAGVGHDIDDNDDDDDPDEDHGSERNAGATERISKKGDEASTARERQTVDVKKAFGSFKKKRGSENPRKP